MRIQIAQNYSTALANGEASKADQSKYDCDMEITCDLKKLPQYASPKNIDAVFVMA